MIYNEYCPLVASLPVTVPQDFVGLHWFGFPSNGQTPNTPFQSVPYKVTYNNDWDEWGASESMWALVEQTQGVYTWTALDKFIAGQAAHGINICYSMLYCPSFYSANPTLTGGITSTIVNPFQGYGGPLTAGGLTGLSNYVTAVINRYKAKGTPIKYWQSWEEPDFSGYSSAAYWWGTASQLVDMAYVTYQAAKAADPNIIVMSPSASPPSHQPDSWINATGTTYPGVSGYQTYDWYGVDLFGYWPTHFQKGFDTAQPTYLPDQIPSVTISEVLATMRSHMGSNVKPISVTSYGFSFVGDGPTATQFRAYTPLQRKQYIGRALLEFAAQGVQNVIIYGGDSNTYIGGGGTQIWAGDFVNDTNGVILALQEFASSVVGKTITSCGYRGDGQMFATFSDGSTYTV